MLTIKAKFVLTVALFALFLAVPGAGKTPRSQQAASGKAALLQAVDRLGSIQQAADEFGMSYRHAWGAIRRIENRAGFKIVDTKLGGKEGGGARLTPQGKA
ncbi:MAG: LysR family transcriptional regulator, partial [Acidobacteriia bacterium]|nr:LysR family transcriptional regulator [Terriglobia bacterium]